MDIKELFDALEILETQNGIPTDYMLSQIKKAIIIACKNTYNGNDDVNILMDKEKRTFEVNLRKTVVETVEDSDREISLEDAREINPIAYVDDKVNIKLDPQKFGRIVVQTARSIIRQGIKDGERGQILVEFKNKKQEIVTATVEKIDMRTGNLTIKINEKAVAVLPKSEQIPTDNFTEGDHVKVYIADVKETEKGPKAIISRTHPDFVKRLFETEVPEIFEGIVEIKSISREAGSRTKMSVTSKDSNVDALGACIGAKRTRVSTIVNELGGEKIDIIEYHIDPKKYIAMALSPANVVSVDVATDGSKSCRVTVPDNQLSLAIGNKGQNARLAAKLTGWKIDIKPQSGFFGEDEQFAEKQEETTEDESTQENVIVNDEILVDDITKETIEEVVTQEITEEVIEETTEEVVEETEE